MLAPFIAVFGVRGAFVVPMLGLVLAVLITARWIRDAGYSPFFALVTLGFAPALVMGRVAMSDVPSATLGVCSGSGSSGAARTATEVGGSPPASSLPPRSLFA